MTKTPRPKQIAIRQRFGQLIMLEHEEGNNIWIVIPSRNDGKLIAGLVRNQSKLKNWQWGIIDPEELALQAGEALECSNRFPLANTSVEGMELLWILQDTDGTQVWQVLGVLEYGKPPDGSQVPMKWIKLSPVPSETALHLGRYTPEQVEVKMNSSVNDLLEEVSLWEVSAEEVVCSISIDTKKRAYRVELGKSKIRKEFAYTQEVVDYVREPLKTGKYPVDSEGTVLKYDIQTDVSYDTIFIKKNDKKERIDLSFLRPLIYKSKFYPEDFKVPTSCEELLNTQQGKDITLEVNLDRALVKIGVFACLKVKLEGISANSELNGLNRTMNIYDVALLAECNQIIDIANRTRHDMSISLKDNLEGFSIPDLSDFSRIDGIFRSLEEAESYDEEYEEQDYDFDVDASEADVDFDTFDENLEIDGSLEKEEDDDEGIELQMEIAQKFEINARTNLSMKDYNQALENIERSMEILLLLEDGSEEIKFAMLRVLLLKTEVSQKAGSKENEHFQVMKVIVDNLDSECEFEKRPLYQQRVIEQVKTSLNNIEVSK